MQYRQETLAVFLKTQLFRLIKNVNMIGVRKPEEKGVPESYFVDDG
jgi:hypothetical protein